MATLHQTLQQVSLISEVAYRELIKTHLARLIDIDSGFDFDQIYQYELVKSDSIFGANLTQEGICSINQLIDYISQPNNIIKEGLFRVSGSRSRQQELKNLLSQGQTIYIDSKRFSVHDCCDVLKRFLMELPEPILTKTLQPIFLKTLRTTINDEEKRLDALRLLILLLPNANRYFLYDLLYLFDLIVKNSDKNLMTTENISTIFSMNFFKISDDSNSNSNSSTNSRKVYEKLHSYIKLLNYMIENFKKLFEPPKQLLIDSEIYLKNYENQMKLKLKNNDNFNNNNNNHLLISTTNLSAIPAAKFCQTPLNKNGNGDGNSYSSKDYTELQLAELYAQVQMMSKESPMIKKKFLKRFNQNKNGFMTPPSMLQRDKKQQELIKQSLKKSSTTTKSNDSNRHNNNNHNGNFLIKNLGSAIKKKLMMTPNNSDKIKTSKSHDNCNSNNSKKLRMSKSPVSIVPVVEELKTKLKERNDNNLGTDFGSSTLENSIKEKSTRRNSRIAIVSPMKRSKENLIKDQNKSKIPRLSLNAMKSKSNSILSATRLKNRPNSTSKTSSSSSSISRSNQSGQIILKSNIPPAKIKSLPTNFGVSNKNKLNLNDDNEDDNTSTITTSSTIRRKKVKYLALKYEELIASNLNNNNGGVDKNIKQTDKTSNSSMKSTTSSSTKSLRKRNSNNNQSIEDQFNDSSNNSTFNSEYVSLTSIYTTEPLERGDDNNRKNHQNQNNNSIRNVKKILRRSLTTRDQQEPSLSTSKTSSSSDKNLKRKTNPITNTINTNRFKPKQTVL